MTDREWLGTDSLVPNERSISSEEIDGEAILMNHDSGIYFNSTGSGGLIWRLIGLGASQGQIAAALAAHYGLEAAALHADVAHFVAQLDDHGLIVSGGIAPQPAPVLAGLAAEGYQPPELGVHTDLADLLLLDPIHEVSEAGWPAPQRTGHDGQP